jgi:hypothetical protein
MSGTPGIAAAASRLTIFVALCAILSVVSATPGHADPVPSVSRVISVGPTRDAAGKRTYALILKGTNFLTGTRATDNFLVSDRNQLIVPCEAQPSAAMKVEQGCVRVEVTPDGNQITYSGISGDRAGPDNVAVEASGQPVPDGKDFKSVTFPVPGDMQQDVQIALRLFAIVVVFGGGMFLAFSCLRLFRDGAPLVQRPTGLKSIAGMLETLVIDTKTQTYSLSCFQFAAWSFAFLIAYLYLFVGRILVQGSTEFIDLPADFATMLAATGGTAVVASGIDAAKGCKGSGEIHPALSDLVSNGGVFAPERFQFLIWTVVGIAGYLIVTFSQPLDMVAGLPQVGTGILQLSGISGLAYLGGKLTRTAGPVIATIATPPNPAAGAVVRRLSGQQLSLEPAAFYVVRDTNAVTTTLVPGVAGGSLVVAVMPVGITSGFATSVDVTLPAGFVFPGTITVTNPDEQKAVATLT